MKSIMSAHAQLEEPRLVNLATLSLQNLFRLQALEFEESPARHAKPRAAELRSQIPVSMLDRYDRLRAHEKKAIAIVLNSTCSACHMRQPTGKMAALIRGQEIQLCDSCGRYLLLPEPVAAPMAASITAAHAASHRMASSRVAR